MGNADPDGLDENLGIDVREIVDELSRLQGRPVHPVYVAEISVFIVACEVKRPRGRIPSPTGPSNVGHCFACHVGKLHVRALLLP